MSRFQAFLLANLSAKLALFLFFPRDHPWIVGALFFVPDIWLAVQLLAPNARGFIPVITGFETSRKEVWLTIDDGPDPITTERVLTLLDRHHARATFFLIGERARTHPDLVKTILLRGHMLANHTEHHPLANFALSPAKRVEAEIDACAKILGELGAPAVPYFRPPAGVKSIFLPSILKQRGLRCIGWTARGRESFARSPEIPLARLKRRLRPGAILLTHESSPNAELRLAVLAGLLEHLTREGYACVIPAPEDLR